MGHVDLTDVAKAVGVSRATASRALRGASRVSDETREKVLAAAAELGYVRDRRAADLAAKETRTLGLLIRSAERSFYGEIAARVQDVTDELGFNLLMVNGGDHQQSQMNAVDNLLGHRVSGIVIASGRASLEAALQASRFVPTVLVGLESPQPQVSSVAIDPDEEDQLAKCVLSCGHNRVAVTTSTIEISPTLQSRAARYIAVLNAAGADVTQLPHSGARSEGFTAALKQALDSGVSAVMAGDDAIALEVLEHLYNWGIRCPEEVSVTGFDGVGVFQSPLLGITTVKQPLDALARAAVELLASHINGDELGISHRHLHGSLIAGRTLGKTK